MNKHVSITEYPHMGLNVVIWRGDVMREYWITESSKERLTLFCWNNDVNITPHFESLCFWFDFPKE